MKPWSDWILKSGSWPRVTQRAGDGQSSAELPQISAPQHGSPGQWAAGDTAHGALLSWRLPGSGEDDRFLTIVVFQHKNQPCRDKEGSTGRSPHTPGVTAQHSLRLWVHLPTRACGQKCVDTARTHTHPLHLSPLHVGRVKPDLSKLLSTLINSIHTHALHRDNHGF